MKNFDATPFSYGRVARSNGHTSVYDGVDEFRAELDRIGWDSEDIVTHELAHIACANTVGIRQPRLGIVRFPNGQPDHPVTIFGAYRRVPRLALAAVRLAPEYPSVIDYQGVIDMGYQTIAEISDRILVWNDASKLKIPLPGSHRRIDVR